MSVNYFNECVQIYFLFLHEMTENIKILIK